MAMTRKKPPVIDSALEQMFLEALAPVSPRPARKAAMKARILARLRPSPGEGLGDFVTVHLHDGAWRRLAPKVYEKALVDAAGLYARLLRLEPGARLPAHDHPTSEECMVLEGEVWLGDEFCVAGEFHFAPRGRRHADIHTARGCLLYVRTGGVGDHPAPR